MPSFGMSAVLCFILLTTMCVLLLLLPGCWKASSFGCLTYISDEYHC
jgi:hypothetical protein